MRLLGADLALPPARDTGLTVDDQGNTTHADKESLSKLIDAYCKLSGRVAIVFARGVLAKVCPNGELELPDNLK
jgi:hypothetical protein